MATDRINPDTVSVGGLKPQATPVDTMIHLSKDVDLSKEKSLMATAEGIANFGKGMIEIQPVLQDHALREANKIYEKNIAQNKREWKDASDKGFAKFNPYTKDYYNQLMSDEVVMSKWAKFLKDNPRLEYETPDVADAKLKEFKTDVIQTLEDRKYSSRQIEGALTKSAALASNKSLEYYDKYATVEYGRGLNAYSNSLSNKIINTTFDETTTLDGVINTECAIARENGFTREDTAKAVEDSLKRTIKYKMMNDPTFTTKNRAEYMAALDNLTIDGVSIKDINPNLKQNISDHFDQVQSEVWSLENRQFDQYQKQQEMIAATIMAELGEIIQKDPSNNEAIIAHANQAIKTYGLYGKQQTKILEYVNGLRGETSTIEDGYRNRQLVKDLEAEIYSNEAMTVNDIVAYKNQLTESDLGSLLAHFDTKNQRRLQAVRETSGYALKSFNADLESWAMQNISDKYLRQAFVNKIKSRTTKLYGNVIKSSDVSAAGLEFNQLLDNISANYQQALDSYQDASDHEDLLTNTRPPQFKNRLNEDSGFLFFKPQYNTQVKNTLRAGEIPTNVIAYNPKVTSEFGEQRKGYKHQGVDVATNMGDLCVNPLKQETTVKAFGYQKNGYGNYVILDLGNGYTATFGHLDSVASGLQKGMRIPVNGFLGYTGNSGKSTGAHTDVSFRKDNYPVDPDADPYILSLRGIK